MVPTTRRRVNIVASGHGFNPATNRAWQEGFFLPPFPAGERGPRSGRSGLRGSARSSGTSQNPRCRCHPLPYFLICASASSKERNMNTSSRLYANSSSSKCSSLVCSYLFQVVSAHLPSLPGN